MHFKQSPLWTVRRRHCSESLLCKSRQTFELLRGVSNKTKLRWQRVPVKQSDMFCQQISVIHLYMLVFGLDFRHRKTMILLPYKLTFMQITPLIAPLTAAQWQFRPGVTNVDLGGKPETNVYVTKNRIKWNLIKYITQQNWKCSTNFEYKQC